MKNPSPIALLAAGRIRDSFLRKIPSLRERLGPVGSSSYRLASRISNLIGCGYPISGFEAFNNCPLILMSVPEAWLAQSVAQLLEAGIEWNGKTVLLCDAELGSEQLDKLSQAGASVGSLAPVPGGEDRLLVAEGDRKAVREARLLAEQPGVRVVAFDRGQKALYSAAVCFATSLALPLLTASVETMRACGMDPNDAQTIADRLFQKTLRSYLQGGRKAWEGPLPAQNRKVIRRHVQALFRISPLLASYYYENAVLVAQIFRQDPQWLRDLAVEAYAKAAATG